MHGIPTPKCIFPKLFIFNSLRETYHSRSVFNADNGKVLQECTDQMTNTDSERQVH